MRSVLLLVTSFVAGAAAMLIRPLALRQSCRLLLRAPAPSLLKAARDSASVCGEGTAALPRVAPDEQRARAVLDAWEADADILAARARGVRLLSEPCVYGDDPKLHGRFVWAEEAQSVGPRPGVLLVHTAVGPHDLFLHWRAESLASLGYVVLIADCLGDATGKGWEPAWCVPTRAVLMADRSILTRRMLDALSTLAASDLVDGARLAACGFCFGGRAVLDLARADPTGLRLVASFHGVVDAEPPPPGVTSVRAAALLFHGDADPFVPASVLRECTAQLRALGCRFELHAFGGVRHGFTNPAQDLNPNREAFAYDARAAESSWQMTKLALSNMARE